MQTTKKFDRKALVKEPKTRIVDEKSHGAVLDLNSPVNVALQSQVA